jgi:TonB family protein
MSIVMVVGSWVVAAAPSGGEERREDATPADAKPADAKRKTSTRPADEKPADAKKASAKPADTKKAKPGRRTTADVEAAPAPAADAATIKTEGSALTDLTNRAGRGNLELGRRATSLSPEVEESVVVDAVRLSPAQVRAVVALKTEEIRYCYDRAMVNVKDASGEVSVRFVVAPKGTVDKVEVTVTGSQGKGLEKCVVQRVKKWQFPETDAETPVELPFVFAPAQ